MGQQLIEVHVQTLMVTESKTFCCLNTVMRLTAHSVSVAFGS